MSKHIEKLKKQLTEISEVVNLFKSEAVQLKIVEKLLDVIIESDKAEAESTEVVSKKGHRNLLFKRAQKTRRYQSIEPTA